MIHVKTGRAIHQRLPEEDDELLKNVLKGLSKEEARTVLQIMKEAELGSNATLKAHTNLVYDRDPVSMKQFLEDDYYFGRPCKALFPKLKQDLIDIFDDSGRYTTVILTGSIGIGKTFTGTIIFCRILYELSCMRSPQRTVGLSASSELHLFLLSKNLTLARTVLLSAVMEKIKQSPYFLTEFPFHERTEEVHFPKNIHLNIGSVGSERVLGLDVFAFLMDETNFLGTSKHKPVILGTAGQKMNVANFDAAEKMFATLQNRIKSRFLTAGRLPGKSILISSKTTTSSFTERRIQQNKANPDAYVIDYATWDVKPAGTFCGNTFRLLVGGHSTRSRVLEDNEVVEPDLLSTTGSMIVDVPIEYREDFDRDLNGSIRDVAGLSTDAISSFISKQSAIYTPTIRDELFHPFTLPQWVIGLSFAVFWNKICENEVVRLTGGHIENHWKPRRHPNAQRVVHVDTSMAGDCTGIAMGYIVRWVEVERRTPGGDETYIEAAPEIEIDFALQIRPQPGEYILLADIRGLIYEFIDHGYQIVRVTCDTYQSGEMLQQVRQRGIDSDILSLDVSPAAYECMRLAMYEGRLRMYRYEPFIEEALTLERDPTTGKVDHPIGGSKDVCDAVAGVVGSLEEIAMRIPVSFEAVKTSQESDNPEQWFIDMERHAKAPREPFKHVETGLKNHHAHDKRVISDGAKQVGVKSVSPPEKHDKQQLRDSGTRTKVGTGSGNDELPPLPFLAI